MREDEEGEGSSSCGKSITRGRRREGPIREGWTGRGRGEGAPPPLGGREPTEELAWRIVDDIINTLPGVGPPSGETPEPRSQQVCTQEARGRESRGRSGGGRGEG